jgi:transcriptional regulator with XRE-family HTH domain
MIKNERQFRITRAQADEFRVALSKLEERPPESADPQAELKWNIQRDALKSQYEDLQQDVDEYLSLQKQGHQPMELTSLEDLPDALIKARIAAGLTQRQLAEKLGIKEQQLQRYEANDYSGASLARLQQVLDALGVKVRKKLVVPEIPLTTQSIITRLGSIGLQRNFVEQRLLGPAFRGVGHKSEASDAQVVAAADTLARMFDWSPELLFSSAPLPVPEHAMAHARFKVPANSSRSALPAYTVYAHYLALLLIQATPNVIPRAIPLSWRHIRQQILDKYGAIELHSITRYIWDLGVVILPLNDTGHFHGATWRFKGRNVIVLKQRTQSEARWIVDLLHELWHAGQNPENPEHATIETEDPYLSQEQRIEEEIATDFAADIVFKGKADALAEMVAKASNRRVEWLKGAVEKVAQANDVRADLLANYLAFRMSFEGQNWWPTATTLQDTHLDPWSLTRDFVVTHIQWDTLHGADRMLLEQALMN